MNATATTTAPSQGSNLTHPGARPAAIAAGVSLAVMAVLAPLAVFGAIPAGLTGLAAVVILVVAVLDVVAAFTLVPVLERGGRTLALVSAGLRTAYAAVFAVAGAHLLRTADVAAFERVWDAGLLIFGAHLVALGVLAWRAPHPPRWVAALVLLAGAGYLVDAVLAAVAPPATSVSLAAFTFIGEVVLLLWLLLRGGRT